MNNTPDASTFRMRFERTIELLNVRLDSDQLARLTDVFQTVSWTFRDIDLNIFLCIGGNPRHLQICAEPGNEPVISLVMDSGLLESAVQSRMSFVQAFLCGRLKVTGANPVRLLQFMNLLQPLLDSYQIAAEVSNVES